MTLSDRLLSENADVFAAMVGHPFVATIKAGRLRKRAFDAYLVHEGAFVETALSIFAHLLARATDMEDKRRIIAILDALANDQIAYFERVMAARAIQPGAQPSPAMVEAFDTGMAEIARTGTFAEIATAMFAAEWMYMTWCGDVDLQIIHDPDLAEWIRLHTEPGFVNQAHWLRRKVDEAGLRPYTDIDRCSAIFRRVLELEYAFHEAPLLV